MASIENELLERATSFVFENWQLVLASVMLGAFTIKQREWFKRRDPECLLKGRDGIRCSSSTTDEIDHLTPQGISYENLGLGEDQIDTPLNGGRICVNHHRGHPNSKHPDAHSALYEYKQDPESFRKLRPKRNELLKNGEIYWNDENGDYLAVVIRRRTIDYTLEHPEDPFPKKNERHNGNRKDH